MKVRISREVKNVVRNFAKTYPQLAESIEAFEEWESKQDYVDEQLKMEYIMKQHNLKIITDTFKNSIDTNHQELVWGYFFGEIRVKNREVWKIEREIDVWMYFLAKELGLIVREIEK